MRSTFAALALALLLAPAVGRAQETPQAAPAAREASALAVADAVAVAAVERAARSVVLIEVDRPHYGERQLGRDERAGLGLQGYHTPGYFTRPEGPASGVVIGPGLVATEIWNVEGDGPVRVTSASGRSYPARRVGRDENVRVALLAVEGADGDLVPLEPAGREPRVGQTVLLVGRTLENAPLVTRGVVGGLGRERGEAFTHSARTSFANAGGALVDLDGRLLGLAVRHADLARQGQSSGVGFGAAWTRFAPRVEAMARGEVFEARPTAFLGIRIDPEFNGVGVRVVRALEGTGAEAAGVQPGDVIRVFNQVEVKHLLQLQEEIKKLDVGTEIVITVRRGEEELDLRAKLGTAPEGN